MRSLFGEAGTFTPFDKRAIHTHGFFLSTVAVCVLEIFTQLPPGGHGLLWWATVVPGLIIASLAIPCGWNAFRGRASRSQWYDFGYQVVATCSAVDAALGLHAVDRPESLYLPLLVAIALHSHGYLTGSAWNQRLGTALLVTVLGAAIYRTTHTPWVPLTFIMTSGLVVFTALLVKSLHVAHLRNASSIKDRAAALKSIHDLLVVLSAREIQNPLENIRVLASPTGLLGYRESISEQILRNADRVVQIVDDCKLESRTRTSLQEVLSAAMVFKYDREVHVDVHGMTTSTVHSYHRMFLIILLHKVIENCCRTAVGHWIDIVVLKVTLGHSGIIIEDNSGAAPEFSDAFSTFIDPAMQSLFGFTIDVARKQSGTRYTLLFSSVEA